MANHEGGIIGDRLRSLIERIKRLEDEKRVLSEDIKKVYAEAKGAGFDPKIMRILIRERRRDEAEINEEKALLEVYKRAIGMLADTPLGEAAFAAATSLKVPASASQPSPAWQGGRQAAFSGRLVTENPWSFDDPRYQEWGYGHAAGQQEIAGGLADPPVA